MSERIRVEDDTYAALASLKRDGESFDDVLGRLLAERRESVHEGAGLWDGTDAAKRARQGLRDMKDGTSPR